MSEKRKKRQRAADNDGRAFRVSAVTRDLMADLDYYVWQVAGSMRPIGSITPASFPAIYGEGIIPPRFPVPARVPSHEIKIDELALGPSDLVREAMEKLALEDERMRRILPKLPSGYSWRGEIQTQEGLDFDRNRGELSIRLVYRLYDRNGQRLDESAASLWARERSGE